MAGDLFPKRGFIERRQGKTAGGYVLESSDDETQLRGVVLEHLHQLGRHTILPELVHVVRIILSCVVYRRREKGLSSISIDLTMPGPAE